MAGDPAGSFAILFGLALTGIGFLLPRLATGRGRQSRCANCDCQRSR